MPIRTRRTITSTESLPSGSDLTAIQNERLNYLLEFYNNRDSVVSLVKSLDRGRNSWVNVNRKLKFISDGSKKQHQYFDALYEVIEVNQQYTPDDIISIVGNVRRDIDLEPYRTRLRRYCEEDFFNLFIVSDVTQTQMENGQEVKQLVGYKPIFKLKPED